MKPELQNETAPELPCDPTVARETLLSMLRTAMRQWGAFLQVQVAIETALGMEGGTCEIRDYIVNLGPQFVDSPASLSLEHVDDLLKLFGRPSDT
jgi:hypothetical protein